MKLLRYDSVSISNYINFVQCLTGPLRRRQQTPPQRRLLVPTQHAVIPHKTFVKHTAVKMSTSSDYTSALVTWQVLCRFLDLILASHVILTPKLDKSRAPTIPTLFFFFYFGRF